MSKDQILQVIDSELIHIKDSFTEIKSHMKTKTEEMSQKNKERFIKIKDICSSFFENTEETTKKMKI